MAAILPPSAKSPTPPKPPNPIDSTLHHCSNASNAVFAGNVFLIIYSHKTNFNINCFFLYLKSFEERDFLFTALVGIFFSFYSYLFDYKTTPAFFFFLLSQHFQHSFTDSFFFHALHKQYNNTVICGNSIQWGEKRKQNKVS